MEGRTLEPLEPVAGGKPPESENRAIDNASQLAHSYPAALMVYQSVKHVSKFTTQLRATRMAQVHLRSPEKSAESFRPVQPEFAEKLIVETRTKVELTDGAYTAVMGALMLLHAVCGVFLVAVGRLC